MTNKENKEQNRKHLKDVVDKLNNEEFLNVFDKMEDKQKIFIFNILIGKRTELIKDIKEIMKETIDGNYKIENVKI